MQSIVRYFNWSSKLCTSNQAAFSSTIKIEVNSLVTGIMLPSKLDIAHSDLNSTGKDIKQPNVKNQIDKDKIFYKRKSAEEKKADREKFLKDRETKESGETGDWDVRGRVSDF